MKYALYFLAIYIASRAGLSFRDIGRQQHQQQLAGAYRVYKTVRDDRIDSDASKHDLTKPPLPSIILYDSHSSIHMT